MTLAFDIARWQGFSQEAASEVQVFPSPPPDRRRIEAGFLSRSTHPERTSGAIAYRLRRKCAAFPLGYTAEFGYAAGFDPLYYEDVAGVIEAGAVGADETAWGQGSGRLISNCAPIFIGILAVAEACDDFIGAIKDDYFAEKVCDYDFAIPFVKIAGHLRRTRDGVNMLAVESESLQSAVAAVGYY